MLLAACVVGAAGHVRRQDVEQLGQLHIAASHSASEAHEAASGVHRFQEQLMSEWEKVRTGVFRMGKLEAPLLTAMIEKFEQEPAASPHAPTEDGGPSPVIQIWSIFINMILGTIFAYIYVGFRRVPEGNYDAKDVAKEKEEERDEKPWRHQCWTCYEEPGTCMCALCCSCIRWAETISLLRGALSFWGALWLFMFLNLFRAFEPVAALMYVVFVVMGVKYRQDIRVRFDLSQGGCSYFTDCLLWMCCPCCAIVQEARHVEDELARDHAETECPEGRKRSNVRSDCWTCRLVSSEGPNYGEKSSSVEEA